MPLVVRCRQLESVATTPIRDILASISERAEMPERRAEFDALVSQALVSGEVLLLVDGLDEIADDSDRVGFVKQLRTFLATYPGVSMVVTSRVAGFRAVGGALSHVCDHYRVSDFDATTSSRSPWPGTARLLATRKRRSTTRGALPHASSSPTAFAASRRTRCCSPRCCL